MAGGVFVPCETFMCAHPSTAHGPDGCQRCGCSGYVRAPVPCEDCGELHSGAGVFCAFCLDIARQERRALASDDALLAGEHYGVDPDNDGDYRGGSWVRDGAW